MPRLNINTDACVVLTDKLERLNRSALPVAVRQTLNNAAFDVKQRTLSASASKNFIRRSPNFFKAFSKVDKATGFNMAGMKAVVGMTDNGKASARTAVANMEKQEVGGVIREGADYLKAARSGNNQRKVTRSNYFDKSKVIKGAFKRSGSARSNFIAAAYVSLRENKRMSISTGKGRFIMQVTSIRKTKKRGIQIRSKLLMKDRAGKPVHITATHFAREAAAMTVSRIPELFRIEAEKQFARALK